MKRLHTFNEFLNEGRGDPRDLTANQMDFLNKYTGKGNWYYTEEREINVAGKVDIDDLHSLQQLPVQFGTVSGDFILKGCYALKTLKGCPRRVTGDFKLDNCQAITTLEGGPQKVKHYQIINAKELKSLKGISQEMDGAMVIELCPQLTSLEGLPEHLEGSFNLLSCKKVKSLKSDLKKIDGTYRVTDSYVTSLEGMPLSVGKSVKLLECHNLKSLEGIATEIGWALEVYECSNLASLKGPKLIKGNVDIFDCSSLNDEESKLVEGDYDVDLLKSWFQSGISIEDFLHKKRGTIKGKEFGF